MLLTRAAVAFTVAALLAACDRTPVEPHTPSPAPVAPSRPTTSSQGASGNALSWDDPPGWLRESPASSMRRAQYRIPRAPGDDADAQLIVITFGPGQGGGTEANLQRWYGQVALPDGGPSAAAATRETYTVGPNTVTVTEVAGRIGGMTPPGMPSGLTFEHGRLLAAIVETGTGAWFFKITGPDATVAAARPAFTTLLHSVH